MPRPVTKAVTIPSRRTDTTVVLDQSGKSAQPVKLKVVMTGAERVCIGKPDIPSLVNSLTWTLRDSAGSVLRTFANLSQCPVADQDFTLPVGSYSISVSHVGKPWEVSGGAEPRTNLWNLAVTVGFGPGPQVVTLDLAKPPNVVEDLTVRMRIANYDSLPAAVRAGLKVREVGTDKLVPVTSADVVLKVPAEVDRAPSFVLEMVADDPDDPMQWAWTPAGWWGTSPDYKLWNVSSLDLTLNIRRTPTGG